MNKKLFTMCLVAVLTVVLSLTALAADTTVYVADNGTGTGESAESPVGALSDALSIINGKGGNIVICGTLTQSTALTIPEQTGNLTITAENGGNLTLSANITLEKNTNSNTFTFDFPLNASSSVIIYGAYNSIVFGNNFTVTGTLDFYGGVLPAAGKSATTNEWDWAWAENLKCVTDLPYSITVNNGTFNVFMGGNRRTDVATIIGSIANTLDITINGGTFGNGVSFDADDALKLDQAFSISGMSIIAGDANLTITGGTFNTPIYIQGYIGQTATTASVNSQVTNSDSKYYAADGNINIDIKGGTLNGCEISAFQNSASYNILLRGDVNISITEDAKLASGMVIDATQVKSYEGENKKATLTYPSGKNIKYVRFDVVNGEEETYDEPLRYACIGDSITQGTGAKVNGQNAFESHSYPAKLLSMMIGAKKDVILSNYGCGATKVCNYTGHWYNSGLAYTLSQKETDADYFIIGLGTNDAAASGRVKGQGDNFYKCYKAFIESYEKLPNTKMVYGTSALYRCNNSYNSNLNAVTVIRPMQKKVLTELAAEGKKITYVDLYALTLDAALAGNLLSGDNLHPNANGYTVYANAIYNALFNGKCTVENFELSDIYVSSTKGTNNAICTQANPTSSIEIAFAKAAPNATIHIIDELNASNANNSSYAFSTPYGVDNLTIVGEGTSPTLTIDCKLFQINSNIKFDNILLKTEDGLGAIYIALNYHNGEFTDTFKTAGTDSALLFGGVLTFADDITNTLYNSVESVSSDNDCTITVNGGSYAYINCGNLHYPGNTGAIYGTYSGNMEFTIGKNVEIANNNYIIYSGANGMNYLTGTITMNVNAWPNGAEIRDYVKIGSTSKLMSTYNEGKNTGTVTLNIAEDLNVVPVIAMDFNNDGEFNLADFLMLADYKLNGFDTSMSGKFFNKTEVSLVNLIRALKMLSK